jgi:hypothetical protein
VRIESGEEARLGLGELSVRVLRCRHPIPACQRARITQPLVVVVGDDVREWSRPMLVETCHDIGAAMLQLGPLVVRSALADWMREAMARVVARRASA